ncbi:hypothetical protein B1813_18935 [Saccharomonospora piscinae]|uniref:Uncharacterized protein n=1 Tax=Saccharomonospora piscinae TaxID=687388 RepID=A0A1V8ZY97_SACPI|nr:hypothetical protein [Saccharomonospora piscinae]OQO89917.1 hypothetical protein B1813_18935 [Saccharomonospora piscinae]
MTRGSVVWIVVSAMVGVAVIVVTRLLLDEGPWAALGQWVGGLGALFAAGVALWVAHQETRHRQDTEFEAAYAAAHFVTSGWRADGFEGIPFVKNSGTRPVTHLRITALHPPESSLDPIVVDLSAPPVLLPQIEWAAPNWQVRNSARDAELSLRGDIEPYAIEIEFQDLAGNTWRRVGASPPTCKSRMKS